MANILETANQSQFAFQIANLAQDIFVVQRFKSQNHELSGHYCYQIYCLADYELAIQDLPGQRAKLIIQGSSGPVYIHGIVRQCEFLGPSLDRSNYTYEFIIVSPLESLQRQQNASVFLNQNVIDIVETILQKSGWNKSSYLFKTRLEYPIRELAMQLNETNFAFIIRLLSQYGLFFHFMQNADQAVLWILDGLENIPMFPERELIFQAESGANKPIETCYQFSEHVRTLAQKIILKNYHYQTPEIELIVTAENQTNILGMGYQYYYGCNYSTLVEGEALAKVYMQALDWQRQTFIVETDCRGLQVGQLFSLTNHPIAEFNAVYRVIKIDIEGNQTDGLLMSDVTARDNSHRRYRAKALLIKSNSLYRSPVIKRFAFPHIIPAFIESINDEVYLDDLGRYRIRFPFDTENPKGEASCPVRLLQASGGKTCGLHFPLHPGTQVAIGFLEGDLDRPVILGVIQNPENPTPVNNENSSQQVWRTWGGHELVFEDHPDRSFAQLATREQENLLKLTANKNQQQIDLISNSGNLEAYAKKTFTIETGNDYIINANTDYVATIKNNYYLTAKQTVTYQSGTSINLKTGKDLQMHAENRVALQAQNLNIKSKNVYIKISQGDLTVNGNCKNIDLHAKQGLIFHGDIQIGGLTGSINTKNGLNLQGTQMVLVAPEINIYGVV